MFHEIKGVSVNVVGALLPDGPETRVVFATRDKDQCAPLPPPAISNGHWLIFGEAARKVLPKIERAVERWTGAEKGALEKQSAWRYEFSIGPRGDDKRALYPAGSAVIPPVGKVVPHTGARYRALEIGTFETAPMVSYVGLALKTSAHGWYMFARHESVNGAPRYPEIEPQVVDDKVAPYRVGLAGHYFAAMSALGLVPYAAEPNEATVWCPCAEMMGPGATELVMAVVMPYRL